MADLKFPRGGANPKEGKPAYYLDKIAQKLHDNEENWTKGRIQNFTM